MLTRVSFDYIFSFYFLLSAWIIIIVLNFECILFSTRKIMFVRRPEKSSSKVKKYLNLMETRFRIPNYQHSTHLIRTKRIVKSEKKKWIWNVNAENVHQSRTLVANGSIENPTNWVKKQRFSFFSFFISPTHRNTNVYHRVLRSAFTL